MNHTSCIPVLGLSTLLVFLWACGGSVVDDTGANSGGGSAGSGGKAASGGSGGGSGTGATGGSAIGGSGGAGAMGGSQVGGSSGTAGTGGSIEACPPMPSCNWCAGETVYDSAGCAAGYRCANGINPCVTMPCDPTVPASCPSGYDCHDDMLCWSASLCGPKRCTEPTPEECNCEWQCQNSNQYETLCESSEGGLSCYCVKNGSSNEACGGTGSGIPMSCGGPTCCGFPQ